MDALVEAIQDVVTTEPETEAQPDPTQPDDGAVETQLTRQISTLWIEHTQLSADRKATARDLRQIRAILAERLYEMKSLLSRPGRGGEWRGWLRERAIPRSTADRLVSRHAETLGSGNEGNVPSGAISEPGDANAETLAETVWLRFGKLLATDESVIQFIEGIAELAGVGHEQRAEGLVIFKPAPEAAEELPATAPAIDPAPQPSEEVSVITEEPAPAPVQDGQAAAAADASNGDAA
jgi:hypothetical protein